MAAHGRGGRTTRRTAAAAPAVPRKRPASAAATRGALRKRPASATPGAAAASPHAELGRRLRRPAAARNPRDLFGAVDRSGSHSVKYELSGKPDGIQMWVADMDLPCCPSIVRAIRERAAHPNFGYTIQPGEAWDAVGRWLVARQGWTRSPAREEFVFSASVVTSFCNVLRVFTSEGDAVLVMTPLYAPLRRAIVGCGRRLVEHHLGPAGELQLDAAGSLARRLDQEGVKLVLLCNPQNPSGRVWRRGELGALATECARRELLVVADEIWADWVLPGSPCPFVPFASVAAPAGCAHIALGAPTKTYSLAGLHASYLVIPDAGQRQRYRDYVEPAFLSYGSTFATAALLAAYVDEAQGSWLRAARAHVAANVERLDASLAPGVRLLRPEATYCAWLDFSGLGLRGEALAARLGDAGLVLAPGSEFDGSGASDHLGRINLACPREMLDRACAALRRLAAAARA